MQQISAHTNTSTGPAPAPASRAHEAWGAFVPAAGTAPPIFDTGVSLTPHALDAQILEPELATPVAHADEVAPPALHITLYQYRARWDNIIPAMVLIMLAVIGMPYAMQASPVRDVHGTTANHAPSLPSAGAAPHATAESAGTDIGAPKSGDALKLPRVSATRHVSAAKPVAKPATTSRTARPQAVRASSAPTTPPVTTHGSGAHPPHSPSALPPISTTPHASPGAAVPPPTGDGLGSEKPPPSGPPSSPSGPPKPPTGPAGTPGGGIR